MMLALEALLILSIPALVLGALTLRSLPRGPDCPACGAGALALRSRLLRALSRATPGVVLEPRWCARCGWEGVTRRGKAVRPTVAFAGRDEPPAPARGRSAAATRLKGAVGDRGSGDGIDLRTLSIHGLEWRVRLACRVEKGEWQGRLVFIAPTGRTWTDAAALFRGATAHAVIGQALGAPQKVLTGRLRALVSD